MELLTVFKWLPYAIFLQSLLISAIESSDADETEQKTKYIELINATHNSLTFLMKFPCHGISCNDDDYDWVYSKGPLFKTVEINFFEKLGHRKVRITNLQEGSMYRVKVAPRGHLSELQNMRSHKNNTHITVIDASTCPATPEKVRFIHVYDKGTDFISVWWDAPEKSCLSTAYYLRWEEYDEVSHTWNKENNGICPEDAIFVANKSEVLCEHDRESICYTIEGNITSVTQYIIEVITTDNSGNCSDPEDIHVKTAYGWWGGISVGGWCLVIICLIVAIGACPVIIRLTKRMAMNMGNKENLIFTRATRNEEHLEDDERDPEGYLISASSDRHIVVQATQH